MVMAAVAGQKDSFDALELSQAQLIRWCPEGCVDRAFLHLAQAGDRIEAAAADHTDAGLGEVGHGRRLFTLQFCSRHHDQGLDGH